MKHYLINSSVDWCDEFDMPFYELLDENMYRIYMYAKLKLGRAVTTKGFGTNEAWEYEVYEDEEYGLDLLQFEPEELSDIEYSIIKDHMPVGTLSIYDDLLDYLANSLCTETRNIRKMTPEQVMKIVDAIAK